MKFCAHLDSSQASGFYSKGRLCSGTTLHPHLSPRGLASGFIWAASPTILTLTLQTSTSTYTLTQSCNYCQTRLYRESQLQPSRTKVLPLGSLSIQIHFILAILTLIRLNLTHCIVIAVQPFLMVLTSFICVILNSIINSFCFATAILLSQPRPLQ